MKEYVIFESYQLADLIERVNEALSRGFVCQGGICVTPENNDYYAKYFQAMTKTY